MVLLRYRRGKLLFQAVLSLTFLVPCLVFYLHPETIDPSGGRFHRLLSSDFGRSVFIPGGIIFFLIVLLGLVAKALGSGVAIEARPNEIVVSGMWGARRIPWGQLGRIEIERIRTLTRTHQRLIFRGGGKTAKVPLGLTRLGEGGVPGLIARIDAMRRGTGRPEAPRAHYVYVPAAGPAGFGRKTH